MAEQAQAATVVAATHQNGVTAAVKCFRCGTHAGARRPAITADYETRLDETKGTLAAPLGADLRRVLRLKPDDRLHWEPVDPETVVVHIRRA